MKNKHIINNIPNIIKYSIKSHLLRHEKILKFSYIYFYNKSILDYISYDLIRYITLFIKRNNWQETKLFYNYISASLEK